ncbi:MAG: lipopolysaccharide heptosyltransferase II [Sphaerobacter sp.]|nr:lipopolysaccharide heptosyltransferase II [Sphaerobacter sp.]
MAPRGASRRLREGAVGAAASLLGRLARPGHVPAPPDPSAVQRLLVVKPCCLGDVLMATPAVRALATHYPNARIDVVTTTWSAPALRGNPRVARVIPYPDRPASPRMLSLARSLRRARYDLAVGLDPSPLVNGLLWLTGAPVRAGIDSQGRGIGLTHPAPLVPSHHETETYLDVLAALGVPAAGTAPEYYLSEDARRTGAAIVPDGSPPTVVIHPGGAVNPGTAMPAKRWPPERFAALADRLAAKAGVRVLLVGAASDRAAVAAVVRAARAPVVNLCGRLALEQLAGVIARAALYVGNDSGVSHLAAAVGTPTVTIFGPTNPGRYRPLGARARVCAPPESWHGALVDLRRGSAPATSVERVTVDMVAAACLDLLGAASEGGA